jgi:hypothetical protein
VCVCVFGSIHRATFLLHSFMDRKCFGWPIILERTFFITYLLMIRVMGSGKFPYLGIINGKCMFFFIHFIIVYSLAVRVNILMGDAG